MTEKQINKLQISIGQALAETGGTVKLIRVRFLAGIIGQVISMYTVFGSLVQLKTRYLFKCLNSKASWNARVLLSL